MKSHWIYPNLFVNLTEGTAIWVYGVGILELDRDWPLIGKIAQATLDATDPPMSADLKISRNNCELLCWPDGVTSLCRAVVLLFFLHIPRVPLEVYPSTEILPMQNIFIAPWFIKHI